MKKSVIFLFVLFISCNNVNEKRFDILSSFLINDLGIKDIDFEQKRKVILVPEFGCKGCISKVSLIISELCQNNQLPDHVTVVYSPNNLKDIFDICTGSIFHDSLNYMFDLRIEIINVTGYEIQGGKILNHTFLDDKKPEQVVDFLTK